MRKPTEGQFALGGLMLLAVWLLAGLPLLYSHSEQAPQVRTEQHSNAALEGKKDTDTGNPKTAATDQEDGGKQSEQREEEGTEFWPPLFGVRLKITDSLLALFTFGLLIFTGLLWRSTDKLWIAGEKQLKLAREALVADQRAWLIVTSFEIESIKIGEIVNGAAGATVEATIKISNVGRTPALKADMQVKLIGNYGVDFATVQEFAIKSSKRALIAGRLIGAGETIEQEIYAYAPGEELYQYGMRGKIRPLIVGCINYQILQARLGRQRSFTVRNVLTTA
jgi:hypothetical protein